MTTLPALRASLGLPEHVERPDADPIPVTRDVATWYRYLTIPFAVPAQLLPVVPAPAHAAPDPTALILTAGPQRTASLTWPIVHVSFDTNGTWREVSINSWSGRATLPRPELGFLCGDAAHLTAVLLAEDTSSTAWANWAHSNTLLARSAVQERRRAVLDEIARLRGHDHVERDAMLALAAEHPEEYARHLEAQTVIRALSSSWFPDPR